MTSRLDPTSDTGLDSDAAATLYVRVKGSLERVLDAPAAEFRDPVTGFTREEAEPPF